MNNFDPNMINQIQNLIAQNPQLASLLQKPGILQKLQQIAMNPNDPNLAQQVSSDPDIQQVMSILRNNQGMGGGGFPNAFGGGMGGAGGGLPGMNNFGNNSIVPDNDNANNNGNAQDGGKNMIYINSKSQFDDIVRNTKDKLIACDFYATWCGPCKVISPEFDRLAKFYKNKAIFLKIDVDRVKDLSKSCGIRAMPTFQFYKNGVKIDEFKGANRKQLDTLLASLTYEPPKPKTFPSKYFPIAEGNRPVFAKIPPFDKVHKKIVEKNSSMEEGNKAKLSPSDMKVIKEICDFLNAKQQWMSQKFTEKHYHVLSKALDWETKNVTLILDTIRVLVVHPDVVDHFKKDGNFDLIEKVFRNHGKVDDDSKQSKNNAILACRIVINMFNKTGLKLMLKSQISTIANGLIGCMNSQDQKVRLAFVKVLMQCSFVLYNLQEQLLTAIERDQNNTALKKANDGEIIKIVGLKIRCFSMLAEALSVESDVQNILAILMSLGTLLFRDENVIAFGNSIEFKMVLKQCNKRFGIENEKDKEKDGDEQKDNGKKPTPDIAICIAHLLRAIDNPKE